MWLPRRVKNTGQRCAHCDPVPIRRPATGLNGEEHAVRVWNRVGGSRKNHPGRITLRRGAIAQGTRVGTVNLSVRVSRMQATGSGDWVHCKPMPEISAQIRNFWVLEAL